MQVAARLNGEIISADSRQVYRGMDIGTGKDLADYQLDNQFISYHLIDNLDAGDDYNVHRYQQDFGRAVADIASRNRVPVVCGGTGLYLSAVLNTCMIERLIDRFVGIAVFRILADYCNTDLMLRIAKGKHHVIPSV